MKTILRGAGLLVGILALLLPMAAAVAADTYPITGTIRLADGRPVEGVAIYLDGGQAALTDRSGQYMVPAAAAGVHQVQPVLEGMTFMPVLQQVTLPPGTEAVDFTALESRGGVDSTIPLPPADGEATPFQVLLGFASRWQGVFHQLIMLMLVLSAGAFLALTARRLRSGEWSLAFLFSPGGMAEAPGAADRRKPKPGVEHVEWEMLHPEETEPAVEAPFEVVGYAEPAAEFPQAAEPEPALAEAPAEAEPVRPAAPVEDVQAPQGPVSRNASQITPQIAPRITPRIAVRRYGGAARAPLPVQAEPVQAEPVAAVTTGSRGLEAQSMPQSGVAQGTAAGIALVEQGRLAEGEALLRQVLQQDAQNAEAWYWLGTAKLRQGERRTAERCFLQAQRLGHNLMM